MKENNSNNTIVYNEAKVSEAQDLLNEIKNDLSDADNTLYDAVMKISRARGIENVEVDETAIDMRMPERLMIQCREDTKTISDTLDNQVHAIESFFGREDVKADNNNSSNVQFRKENISGVTAEQGESTDFYYDKNGNKVILDDKGKIISSNTTTPSTVPTSPQTNALITEAPSVPITTSPTNPPTNITGPMPTTAPRTFPTNPATTTPATVTPPTSTPPTSTTPISTTPRSTPSLETVPDTKGGKISGRIPNNQVVYAGPNGFNKNESTIPPKAVLEDIETPAKHMLLYGGPNMPTAAPTEPVVQALYSAPPYIQTDPISTPIPSTPIDNSKQGDYLGTIIVNSTVPQTVPTNPITNTDIVNTTTAIQERISDSALAQHTSPISSNLKGSGDTTNTGYTDSTPQYSSIPETGVGMKDSFGDYITPAAIGAAAGIAGMIAARSMHKKKEKEEENE